jgi:hypothetical protein
LLTVLSGGLQISESKQLLGAGLLLTTPLENDYQLLKSSQSFLLARLFPSSPNQKVSQHTVEKALLHVLNDKTQLQHLLHHVMTGIHHQTALDYRHRPCQISKLAYVTLHHQRNGTIL